MSDVKTNKGYISTWAMAFMTAAAVISLRGLPLMAAEEKEDYKKKISEHEKATGISLAKNQKLRLAKLLPQARYHTKLQHFPLKLRRMHNRDALCI